MSSFDFSLYEEDVPQTEKKEDAPIFNTSSKSKPVANDLPKGGFDFSLYEEPEPKQDKLKKTLEKDKFYQEVKTPDYSPEQIKNMSFYDKMKYAENLEREQDYLRTRGSTKSAASRLTFGFSERYEGGELLNEPGEFAGQLVGDIIPIAVASTLIGAPLAGAAALLRFGPKAQAATRVLGSGITGSTLEGVWQAVKGEGFDILEIGKQGAVFGAIHGLIEGVPALYRWFNSASPSTKSKMVTQGGIPPDLPPSKYKVYEQEVVPKLMETAKQESEVAYTNAVKENEAIFQQRMGKAKANHEREMYELSQKKQSSQEDFANVKNKYDRRVEQINLEHQEASEVINKENQKALEEYEQLMLQYEQLKKRQQLVNEAIQPESGSGEILQGRASPKGEDAGVRPTAPFSAVEPIENRVGSIVSRNSIADTAPGGTGNKTTAGRTQQKAVRASDAADYENVKDAYKVSEELNSSIEVEQPILVENLKQQRDKLLSIPKLSPVQEQKLGSINAILNEITVTNESGDIVGLNAVNNSVLQEQAKSLRYFMDYNFQHGNSRGILQPTVDVIEDAIAYGATTKGDEIALDAHKKAKNLYSEWAKTYDNKYIRKYREVGNESYIELFDDSLNIDNFNALDNVLGKSNAGQQVSGVTRRALVDKVLAPFYENPKKATGKAFESAMGELRAVLSTEEIAQIRNQFNIDKKSPDFIRASKVEPPKQPTQPKTKPLPDKKKISEFKGKPKTIKETTVVNVPVKGPVKETDATRRVAHKLNMTTDDVIKKADSISGFREIKQDLMKTPDGKKAAKLMDDFKNRDILFEGKIKGEFKGDELKRILQKGDNFDFMVEIHGEDVALDMLEVAEKIADQKITADKWKKFAKKAASLKVAHLLGLF